MTGIIKSMPAKKMYGFIRTKDGQEIFFHKQDFVGDWDKLEFEFSKTRLGAIKMEFELADSPKGPRAAKVRRIDD